MKQEVEGHKINPTLDEKKGQDVLFGSFYFSQGNVPFQYDIFSYLHIIRPNWYIDHPAFPRQLIRDQKFKKKAYNILLSNGEKHSPRTITGRLIDKDIVQDSLLLGAKALIEFINGEIIDVRSDDELIAKLTRELIERDHKYLIEKGGRPRGPKRAMSQADLLSPYDDPFLSHFCYYVLSGNKTGIEEFDEMFADIKRDLNRSLSDKEYLLKDLKQVINVYNDHHPNSKVSLSQLDAESLVHEK